jgi:hypothetical protein
MSDDGRDEAETLRSLIEANLRPWNSFWTWRDKPIGEHGAASEILQQACIRVVGLESRPPGSDPPDCEAMLDGQWSGVEVTELVDEKTLSRSIRALKERAAGREPEEPEAHFVWDRDSLLTALQGLIDAKDAAKLKGGPYERYVLIIHTNELFLDSSTVRQFLRGAKFRAAQLITDVIVGLSYEPSSGCPAFRLELAHSDDHRSPATLRLTPRSSR